METLEFSQKELRTIMSVFNHAEIKLGDAINMLPIAEKILAKIKEEPPKPPVDEVTKVK